jgi:hypothetical protein
MASVDDEMEIESEEEDNLSQSLSLNPSSVSIQASEENGSVFEPPPEDNKYGEPRLDGLPTRVLRRVLSYVQVRSIMSVRMVRTLTSFEL